MADTSELMSFDEFIRHWADERGDRLAMREEDRFFTYAQLEERTARVLAELRAAGECTLYELCERLYPRALRRRFWQIASTVQGHLDLLEARGAAHAIAGRYRARTGE